jgi:hypothetical protein
MPRIDPAVKRYLDDKPKGLIAIYLKDVYEDILAFSAIAKGYLAAENRTFLEKHAESFLALSSVAQGTQKRWSTGRMSIRTKASEGDYQPDSRGGRKLFAIINFVWDLEFLGTPNTNFPLNRHALLHNSSIRIELHDHEEQGAGPVACWDFDVGNHESPGCHFHAKAHTVRLAKDDSLSDVDVPRLPSLIFMPSDAIDFIIGELWQDEWKRKSVSVDSQFDAWRKICRERMRKLFEWHQLILRDSKASAWMALKTAKPTWTLLCS